MPNQPSTVLARPNRTPLKIDSFQISEATTYEHAVGRKNTDRKNARAIFTWLTSSASASDSANVSGTMNTANSVKVPRLDRNGLVGQHVDVVLEPDELRRRDRVVGLEEAEDQAPDDRQVGEDQQADDERPDEDPEPAGVPGDPLLAPRPPPLTSGGGGGLLLRGGTRAHPNSRVNSVLTVFSALVISAAGSAPFRMMLVSMSPNAVPIFGVHAGLSVWP